MARPQILSIPERLDAHPDFRGRGVCVGFVDAGFYAHPDLMRPARRIRAFVDVTREQPADSEFFTAHPRAWHGTMAACSAAGNGWSSGGRYRGLACEAEVVLIKACSDGGEITGKNVAAAIRFPLKHPELGIQVLNVSLGVDADDPHAQDVELAVREVVAAGVTVFAAAGNSPGQMPEPPATATEAITVGGGNDGNTSAGDDDRPWPSSHGSPRPGVSKPDLLAPAIWLPAPVLPGTLVAREGAALFQLLSVLEELTAEQAYLAGSGRLDASQCEAAMEFLGAVEGRLERGKHISADHQHVDGTSFASPIAASVAAQMLEADPSLTPALIREGLLATAVKLKGVAPAVQGAGLLGARGAVEWARRRSSR